MARAHTKCTVCNELLWFDEDSPPPQHVVCSCDGTELTEAGPVGNFTPLTNDEIGELTFGIQRKDLKRMRTMFDTELINRPRHCFRWNNSQSRWELSEVAPVNRTLIAYRGTDLVWVKVV